MAAIDVCSLSQMLGNARKPHFDIFTDSIFQNIKIIRGDVDQDLDVYVGFADEGMCCFYRFKLLLTSSTVCCYFQFPRNVPALCKRCCCGVAVEDEDDLLTDRKAGSLPRSISLQFVQSESKSRGWKTVSEEELPGDSSTITRMPSDVFAKKDKPTCRLSCLSDDRYCIDDTRTAGGEVDEVQLSSLRIKTAPHTSPGGFNTLDIMEGNPSDTS